MIRSFRDPDAKALFVQQDVVRYRNLERVVRRKLEALDAARALGDLAASRGNNLEALKGSRLGQHSIRIDDQFLLCFVWQNGDALEVEIVDYQ